MSRRMDASEFIPSVGWLGLRETGTMLFHVLGVGCESGGRKGFVGRVGYDYGRNLYIVCALSCIYTMDMIYD